MSTSLNALKLRGTVLATLAAALVAGPVAAQTPVYPWPGDQSWSPSTSGSGSAFISPVNPRYGNGSLRLGVTGDLFDWGFYQALSGQTPWGRLADVNRLSFEWYRQDMRPYVKPPYPQFGDWPDAPWLAQTPVLRLLLGNASGLLAGELVWEKWYNRPADYETPYDTWVAEDLAGQNFWFHTENQMYAVSDCSGVTPPDVTPPPVWELLTGTPTGWATGSFTNPNGEACAEFNLGDMYIYGLRVGVGSNWPERYTGYVDWVRLGFEGSDTDAVWANFEFPATTVPEPGTMILLSTGLVGLAGAGWIRRRKTS